MLLHGPSVLDDGKFGLVLYDQAKIIDSEETSSWSVSCVFHWSLSIGKPRMTLVSIVNTLDCMTVRLIDPMSRRKQTVRAVHSCNSCVVLYLKIRCRNVKIIQFPFLSSLFFLLFIAVICAILQYL